MELKYHKLVIINAIIICSNRTFMELKFKWKSGLIYLLEF